MGYEEYEKDEDKPQMPIGNLFPTIKPPEATSLLVQTNPAELIEEIQHHLKGEHYNADDKVWVADKEAPRLLNNLGINKIMNIIRTVVNTNCILSNLEAKEVGNMIISIGDEITFLLIMRHVEFDADKSDLRTIVHLCCRMCFFALKRSLNEGERRFLKTSVRSSEYIKFDQSPTMGREGASKPFFNLFGKG